MCLCDIDSSGVSYISLLCRKRWWLFVYEGIPFYWVVSTRTESNQLEKAREFCDFVEETLVLQIGSACDVIAVYFFGSKFIFHLSSQVGCTMRKKLQATFTKIL